MTLPYPIAASQTDAKSPVNDLLMDSIRLDLDYLDAQVTGGSVLFQFNLNGPLSSIRSYRGPVDTAISFADFTPGACRAVLKKSGLSGTLKFDLRKVTKPKTPITAISHQFEGATQSIARIAGAINTQSIQRSIAQILTQTITFAKSQINTQSIINVGGTRWRYNFSGSLLDADYQVGKYVTFASHTAGANNGTFLIAEVNQSGHPSIVIINASGVAQSGAVGNCNLQLMSYNFLNPVGADYVVAESCLFASHTTGANNGTFAIYKTNEAGNNIWVYNQTGVTQGAVAGNSNAERWIFAYSSAVSTVHYSVGESASMAAHTSGNNNGNKAIVAINRGGNNLIIYNPAGVVQGGAVGNASSNRWVYALSTNPTADVAIASTVSFESHTTPANNGIFSIVLVNDSASNNLVIYNIAGVAQAGVAGTPRHTRKLIQFLTDQSANYTTASFIEIVGTESGLYIKGDLKNQYTVLQVNRGGGANYNVVIEGGSNPKQLSPTGYIILEAKSIFITPPEIAVEVTSLEADQILRIANTNFVAGLIETATPVLLYIMEIPEGDPQDLTVILA